MDDGVSRCAWLRLTFYFFFGVSRSMFLDPSLQSLYHLPNEHLATVKWSLVHNVGIHANSELSFTIIRIALSVQPDLKITRLLYCM